MNDEPPGVRQQRRREYRGSSPVDDAHRSARTFATGTEEIVPVGRDRAVLVDEVIRSAWAMYERELATYARRATRDADEAADLVQDAFLRLVAEIRAGRRPDQIRPWLYRVLANRVISRGRHGWVVDRWFHRFRPSERVESSPEAAAIADETRSELGRAIGRLSPDARIAVLLAANGFTGPEIAAQLGRTPLATRTLLCRARMQVRASLDAEPSGG